MHRSSRNTLLRTSSGRPLLPRETVPDRTTRMGKWMGIITCDLNNHIKNRDVLEGNGGGGGIRTPGAREGSTVFKTVAFNHSATPPAGRV
jgi:hypothetical protein